MRVVRGSVCWSATDLTLASTCEYAVLRRLDEALGRGEPRPRDDDPLSREVARVGDLHEATIRHELEASAARLIALPRPAPDASAAELRGMHAATLRILRDRPPTRPDVVVQPGFFDGEFLGFADFLIASPEGWVVADAKLARQARPTALLQLAAYAQQLDAAGVTPAPRVRLLLGDGTVEDFALREITPVFEERRARLRQVIGQHSGQDGLACWDDDRYLACGSCPDCREAVERHQDLLLVAGLRITQRAALRRAGARSVADLASMTSPPVGVPGATFEKLRAQARLQRQQLEDGRVRWALVDGGGALARLPAPSPGDIFFDFEGDPLHREADPSVWGLEYLWGVVEAPEGDAEPSFVRWWAHDRGQERAAFVGFMDYVARRRAAHPDMHVYHYAAYETTALKRLAGRYATRQAELDELLRSAVFVDLYTFVRASVRVSQPSYSIKKLEPLTMGDASREGMEVAAGDVSIAEYHAARALLDLGADAEAGSKLRALEDYNRFDCVSTLRLRDWLLRLAREQGIPVAPAAPARDEREEESDEADATVRALRALAGPEDRTQRSGDEQAYAMLASAVGYHRRESLPFWWEHFARLATPDVDDWSPDRDVFRVTGCSVVEDWQIPPRKRVLHRRLLLRGAWGPGSTPGTRVSVVYRVPCPDGAVVPENCGYGYVVDRDIEVRDEDEDEVVLVERLGKDGRAHDAVPVALVPTPPPHDAPLRVALREVAETVVAGGALPAHPALDILRRRPPRLATTSGLPHSGEAVLDIAQAVLDLDRSYVAVQGPPGTGKTYTGSRVIRRLVAEHGWRVGVVAQSHAVVENMLSAVVGAGLDPSRIGKKDTKTPGARWAELDGKRGRQTAAAFLEDHRDTGCVLGGTAWTFTGDKAVSRECLDLLVVDEAGQFALANTVAVSVAAERLLLLGDPQQLPQVSQGTHDEPVDTSALRWVMGESETLPRHLGYFLETTYRMHPALATQVSGLSYDDALTAALCTTQRCLEGVEPGCQAVVVDDAWGNSVCSEEEAAVVVEEVERLLGRLWQDPGSDAEATPLDETGILVVAPYNAQVQLLRRRLRAAGHARVRVGTVDKFQGQQAPVVLVSMTASSPADVPRGMSFLLNRNRVNVAISRAQWLAVLIRSRELTSALPRTPADLLDLGAFLRLGGRMAPLGNNLHDPSD